MPRIQRSLVVQHAANDMYDLVLDVAAYPDFLPWCAAARVISRSETHQVAAVTIAKSVTRSEFITQNRLQRPNRIDMSLLNGPFKHLRGSWQFTPVGEHACRAELEVNFEFGNPFFGRLIAPVFRQVCDSLVGAFARRANEVYGKAHG